MAHGAPVASEDFSGAWTWTQYWRTGSAMSRIAGEATWTGDGGGSYDVASRWSRGDVLKTSRTAASVVDGVVINTNPARADLVLLFPHGKADACLIGAAVWIDGPDHKSAGLQMCRPGLRFDEGVIESWGNARTLRLVREALAQHRATLPRAVADALHRWADPQP